MDILVILTLVSIPLRGSCCLIVPLAPSSFWSMFVCLVLVLSFSNLLINPMF